MSLRLQLTILIIWRRAEAEAIQANHDAREDRKKAQSERDEAYSI